MLRRLLTAQPIRPDGFVHRGRDVTRLEGFSDAAFGFAVTLLVISMEVPTSFEDLMTCMSGLAAFAVCFGLLVHFWTKHYYFFRRYGLQDVTTIVLNSALLFVLLAYVYPLKFLFSVLAAQLLGAGSQAVQGAARAMTPVQGRQLFTVYGMGFFAVYGLFAAMYGHAYRVRHALGLSRIEAFDTTAAIVDNLGVGSVGLISVALARFLPVASLPLAGLIYIAVGPVAAVIGWRSGVRRRPLEEVFRAGNAEP